MLHCDGNRTMKEKILVVDNHPLILELMTLFLEQEGAVFLEGGHAQFANPLSQACLQQDLLSMLKPDAAKIPDGLAEPLKITIRKL